MELNNVREVGKKISKKMKLCQNFAKVRNFVW
jgi:hypothetical protein